MIVPNVKTGVDGILDRYWDGYIPVDIESIVKNEGIFLEPISDQHSAYSGIASIDSNGKKIIAVNTRHSANHQRFAVAHELAHHVLGHVTATSPQHRDDAQSFSGNNIYPIEIQANQFATQILIPFTALDYMIRKQGVTDISNLAEAFAVSEQAIYYRMLHLGYLQ